MGRQEIDHNAAAFRPAVDDVFARLAGRYDLLCDIFSLFIHRHWKAVLARSIAAVNARDMLDVASGTGHIPERVVPRLATGTGRRMVVTDLSPEMLAVARRKLAHRSDVLTFECRDAHTLDGVADASFDLVSIAFAMKICERDRVVAQAMRVLRPGGSFFCLEASRIPVPPVQALYLAYMNLCLPLMARLATGGDRSAYDYLLRGIHAFPDAEGFTGELETAGFEAVSFRRLSLGIVALHEARKPAS